MAELFYKKILMQVKNTVMPRKQTKNMAAELVANPMEPMPKEYLVLFLACEVV